MSVASVAKAGKTRQFRTAPASSPLFVEQALNPFLRFFGNLADPDEVLRKAGVQRYQLRALTGDDEITTALDTRREALLGTPWRLEREGAELSPNDLFIWEVIEPHVESVLSGSMQALPYGYSVQEVVYSDLAGNRVGIAEVTEKPFEWFVPQLDGSVLYKSLATPFGEVTDPRKYLLTARGQTYRNPYGEALFARLYWPWLFRSQGWRFWVKWLERFGTPYLIGETQGSAQVMADALKSAVQDATIAVGLGDKVNVIESAGHGAGFEGFDRVICARIQKVILGQTLTTDVGGSSGKSGSFAAAKVHNEVRKDRRNADIRMCRKTVQKLVTTLWQLNLFPGLAPSFVIEDEQGFDADKVDAIFKLASAGVRITEQFAERAFDFVPGDIVIVDPTMQTPPQQDASAPPRKDQADAQRGNASTKASATPLERFTPKQQAVERGIDDVLARATPPITLKQLRSAIAGATDENDLVERLAVLIDKQDPQFAELLARAQFAAKVLGYVHAAETPSTP